MPQPASLAGPVVVVSHRGPVQHDREDGRRTATRGGGGLVTALSGLGGHLEDLRWVCAAITDEDRAVAREQGDQLIEAPPGGIRVRMLDIDPEQHRQFYGIVANPLLWFVQHQLWNLPYAPEITRSETAAFDDGYRAVNRRFADAVIEEIKGRGDEATVMVHDYHFYLLPALVREACPDAFVHHFVHIPWPQPDTWRVLPPGMREPILRGVLGNDIVAFHTEAFARNFLLCCQELLGLPVDLDDLSVRSGDRTVRARWYPISVDAAHFDELAASPGVLAHERSLAEHRREHLIVRVDRTDLSKNIVRGFHAYDILLDDHPELIEQVSFLAMLQPSRQDVQEYADYLDRIKRVVADVNLKHGTPNWQPIDLRLQEDIELAVAIYKQFDVLVVNAIFDGMNLVAKEAVLVNQRNGVLALSENTGAHQELGAFAVTLHPFDLQQQADAIHRAITMEPEERRARRTACEAVVRQNDIGKWIRAQLADLRQLRQNA